MTDDSPFDFPCDYPIKAMGAASDDFADLVLELIGRHSDQVDVDSLRIRESNGGRYVSVTVTIVATGKPQLEAIYGELRAHDAVLMTL